MRKSVVLCDTLQRNITQPCFERPGFPYKCVRSQHHIKMEQSCVGPVHLCLNILYARHHNLLLVRNRSWILTIYKDKIFQKTLLENKEMVFKKWVKSIQTAGYNGARTVLSKCQSYFCGLLTIDIGALDYIGCKYFLISSSWIGIQFRSYLSARVLHKIK